MTAPFAKESDSRSKSTAYPSSAQRARIGSPGSLPSVTAGSTFAISSRESFFNPGNNSWISEKRFSSISTSRAPTASTIFGTFSSISALSSFGSPSAYRATIMAAGFT